MTSLPNDSKLINITRHRSESLQSYDSEKLGVTPPKRERRFSLSQMLGRRTSVEDHLVRDSKSMINGDGFDKSNYVKLTSASNTNAAEVITCAFAASLFSFFLVLHVSGRDLLLYLFIYEFICLMIIYADIADFGILLFLYCLSR
ncbi:unnamed protein product [Toxocara canis]|uniref:Uncharacterized protein n=1 Tax=Toxocara canis TaxID=6265 RepID=A0A183V8Q7_TOXCA|nr:unnamed protein product [Toxocara canis]